MHDEPQDEAPRSTGGVSADPEVTRALYQLGARTSVPADLEERVVDALIDRGLLAREGRAKPSPRLVATPRAGTASVGRPRLWRVTAAAAGLVLLLAGYATGREVGARQTARSLIAMRDASNADLIAAVQSSGAAYVAALEALAQRRVDTRSATGTGVATAAGSRAASEARTLFLAAADQMVRLSPDDPLAAEILRVLDTQPGPSAGSGDSVAHADSDSTATTRHVVWF